MLFQLCVLRQYEVNCYSAVIEIISLFDIGDGTIATGTHVISTVCLRQYAINCYSASLLREFLFLI